MLLQWGMETARFFDSCFCPQIGAYSTDRNIFLRVTIMASCKKVLKVRRKLRNASKGRKRKNRVRRLGTTAPNLPLNVPNANEQAQAKKK